MQFTLKWINQYVDLADKTPEEINLALNSLGIETESYQKLCQASGVVSAKVIKKEKHPSADKLSVCQVDIGGEVTQIVCGANNFQEGDYVIASLPGAILPGNIKIKASNIRGEKSNGMMCSLTELGYPKHLLANDESKGIYRQSQKIELGRKDVLSLLGFDDVIFDVNITPNRGDLLSVYEIAKELAIYFNRKCKDLEVLEAQYNQVDNAIENNAALGFSLVKIANIKNSLSNSKYGSFLSKIAQPLNCKLVNIYNYIAKELGQPIHLYDASKIKGKIKVTKGYQGSFIAIGKKQITVTKDDLVIMDDNGIIGLAGIIGSESTKIDLNTTEAIMEIACFDATTIRKTSQRIQLQTESSNRFSKQTSPDNIKKAIERMKFVLENELNAIFDVVELSGKSDIKKTEIKFNYDSILKNLGIKISQEKVCDIFARLGFVYKDNIVKVPAYRVDMKIEADLLEELARIYGYENIEEKFNKSKPTLIDDDLVYNFTSKIKKLLVAKNNFEILTYSLTHEDKAKDFELVASEKLAKLSKPLSQEKAIMKRSAIPSMIDVVKWNNDRGTSDISIFEITKIYEMEKSFTELVIMQSGNVINDPLYNSIVPASFITVKKQFQSLLNDIGIFKRRYQIRPMKKNKFFNHFNACEVFINNILVARIGQIHPLILKAYKTNDIYVAQINLDIIMKQNVSDSKAKDISIYPSVLQDYTIDVPRDLNIEKLIMLARKSSKIISNISVTSIYTGNKIDTTKKAVTLKIEYNNSKKTINDLEIKEFRKSLTNLCIEEGFEFRG